MSFPARFLFAAAAASAGLFAAAPAAQAGVKLGLLTCQSDGALGLLVTSKKDYLCTFTPASGRDPVVPYVGRLRTVGVDFGLTGRQDFSWIVTAAGSRADAPGSLAGNYYGASVDAAVASGGGAKVLVGGQDITLQPVGLQAQFGLNVTAGFSRFELRPVATGAVVYKP